jgi:hypothetical protein
LEVRLISIEYSIISLIPEAPAASDDNVHQENYRVFVLGFIDHVMYYIHVNIPFKANGPQESLAETVFEE